MTTPSPDRTPRRFTPAEEYLAITPEALSAEHISVWSADGWDQLFTLDTTTGVAEVAVVGPLGSRAYWFDGYAGEAGVEARVRAALADDRTRCVVMRLDSPGGTVAGLFECCDSLRAAKEQCGKPLVAFAEGSGAYSAAYALASVADEIYCARVAGVGSVGVIATATSYADALAQQGIAVAVVASGSQKTDLHPALPLADAALKRLRARVMDLAQLFAAEVGTGRGLDPADVLGHQAALFHGQAAVAAGLADRVGTITEARTRAADMASAREAKAFQEKHMKALITILGLAATATDAEVEARAQDLAGQLGAVRALVGEGDILGTLQAWKTTAGRYDAAAKELAELKATTERDARAALLVDARKDGRVTPADEKDPEWSAMVAAMPTPTLRTFLGRLKAMPTEAVTPAKRADDGPDAVTLTDGDRYYGHQAGLTDEQLLAQKRRDLAAQREAQKAAGR